MASMTSKSKLVPNTQQSQSTQSTQSTKPMQITQETQQKQPIQQQINSESMSKSSEQNIIDHNKNKENILKNININKKKY